MKKDKELSMRLITDIYDGAAADTIGVRRFAKAMQEKLSQKRAEGRGGWNREPGGGYGTGIPRLHRMMLAHVDKGDPVDIANFCMMIWNRENPTGKIKRRAAK